MQPLEPSRPGAEFSSADLARVQIGPEEAGRIILQYIQQSQQEAAGPIDAPTALIASLVRNQIAGNVRFQVYTYSLVSGAGAGQIQQILTENPLRKALILAQLTAGGIGSDTHFLFESGPPNSTAISNANFEVKRLTALRASSNNPMSFLPAPINPITVLIQESSNANGLIIEGM